MKPFFFESTINAKWLGFDKNSKYLFGICFPDDSDANSPRKLIKFYLYSKIVKLIANISMPKKDQYNRFHQANRYLYTMSPDSRLISIVSYSADDCDCDNGNCFQSIDFTFCLISAETGKFKSYTFDNRSTEKIIQSHIGPSSIFCSDREEWFVKVSMQILNNQQIVDRFYRICLNDADNTGSFEFVAESFPERIVSEFYPFSEKDLCFDRKIVSFIAEPEGSIKIRIYDHSEKSWKFIITKNYHSEIVFKRNFYKIIGANFDYLYAVLFKRGKIEFMKFDLTEKFWSRTEFNLSVDFWFVNPLWPLFDFFLSSNLFAVKNALRFPRGTYEFQVLRDPLERLWYVKNVCNAHSLKELCFMQIQSDENHWLSAVTEEGKSRVYPQSLIKEFFGPIGQNLLESSFVIKVYH